MFISENKDRLLINLDKDNQPDLLLLKDSMGTHLIVGSKCYGDDVKINKVADYLYEITYDEYEYPTLEEMVDGLIQQAPACSGIRYNNWYGRNYDWFYSHAATIVIRVPAKNKRHASIGITNFRTLTNEIAQSKEWMKAYRVLPFHTVDGINDCGVVCSINVVPNEKGLTTGTHPGKLDIYQFSMPRVVLDNADSALVGVKVLNNYNIISTSSVIGSEIHMMIADENSTYIVEFINNKMHVMSDQEDEFDNIPNDLAIMTNFHLTDWNGELKTVQMGYTEDEVRATGLELHADGVERYKILKEHISEAESLESTINVMRNVKYTNLYSTMETDPWYSECNGYSDYFGELNILSPADSFKDVMDYMYQLYLDRTRDREDTWQTVHCTSYDIENKKLAVCVLEEEEIFTFELNPAPLLTVNKEANVRIPSRFGNRYGV